MQNRQGSRRERPDSFRTIIGLEWARTVEDGPFRAPRAGRGAKGQGIRYEREVARALPEGASHGQWFQFKDAVGLGYCQPDLLLRGLRFTLVLEVKLTWLAGAHRQLDRLYRPVVEAGLGLPMLGVVVVRNLVAGMPGDLRVVGELKDAVTLAKAGKPSVLHWRGGVGMALLARADAPKQEMVG